MTTSRIVRGTKGRIFVYIVGVIFVTAVIGLYNKTLSDLEAVRKARDACTQENENLSTQLQMVSDYKQRLEKSLKTEKAEHQQSKSELAKISDEKNKNEKTAIDAKVQLSSLQQHYNLLQTQHDDFKQKCSETQQDQLNEMKKLQLKLKELEQELEKVETERENLKSEYVQLQVEKEKIQENFKVKERESEIKRLTKENSFKTIDFQNSENKNQNSEVGQVPDPRQNNKNIETSTSTSKQIHNKESSDNKDQFLETNGDEPPAHDNDNLANEPNKNVLATPNNDNMKSISPAGSSKATSRASLDGARPIGLPTVTPENAKRGGNQHSQVLPIPYVKLPEGVVPVPSKDLDRVKKTEQEDKNAIDNEINEALPNRYRNNIIENERANEERAEKSERDIKFKLKLDEAENAAHEVFDAPLVSKEKLRFDAHHINMLGDGPIKEGHIQKIDDGQEGLEYDKEGQNEAPADDPEEDDDADDYGARLDKIV